MKMQLVVSSKFALDQEHYDANPGGTNITLTIKSLW